MAEGDLKITIVGEGVESGGGTGGGGGSSKRKEKTQEDILANTIASAVNIGSIAAVVTQLDLSIDNMVAGVVTLPFRLATLILGPIGAIMAGAVQAGVKKALNESEAFQGLKKATNAGFGALGDSIIGMGYMLYKWFDDNWSNITDIMDIVLDPVGWIIDKIAVSDLISDAGIGDWIQEKVIDFWSTKYNGAIQILDFFGADTEAIETWIGTNLVTPIKTTLFGEDGTGAIDFANIFNWLAVKTNVEDGYDYYIKPALKNIQNFADILGFKKFDIPEDIIPEVTVPGKLKLDPEQVAQETIDVWQEIADSIGSYGLADATEKLLDPDYWANINNQRSV